MRLAIVDYGSGNLRSVARAFAHAGARLSGALEILVTAKAEDVLAADRIVLPGVGAFADCRRGLTGLAGMVPALRHAVLERGRPFLGICVGMQLLADWGREHGDHDGLGWIGGEVLPLCPRDPTLKIPQMGWNQLIARQAHPLMEGLAPDAHAYFVHSFHFQLKDPANLYAEADYGGPVAALIGSGNIAGTQFHPEKSQAVGLKVIENFLRWTP